MKTLKLGMRDAAVKILQTELNRIGNKLPLTEHSAPAHSPL